MVHLEVYLLLSLVLTCVLTRCEYGGGWVWDARHHCLGLRRCCGPNSFNTDKGRCPLDNPCEMLTKATLLLLLLLIIVIIIIACAYCYFDWTSFHFMVIIYKLCVLPPFLSFTQVEAVPHLWAQQLIGYRGMEAHRATYRSAHCWLPHQSRKSDREDRPLQSGNRYVFYFLLLVCLNMYPFLSHSST